MKIDYAAIGLRIRKLRKQKFWTQEKLSEKAEIAPDYLCRIELGRKHPSLKTLLLIANALDTSVDNLLVDVQKKSVFSLEKEEKSLFAGCTEKQRRFMIEICRTIKEEMMRYDNEAK
ncbi:MAG: helix-turn-helix domain-containing protein [Roseburia sp.]|nr:helix-turn-helix domain-containing protein [Roseburia sp.]